ncbi:MAG: site-specific DNA-methyltransferase [Leeuwenhoekiella sp.]|nr:MAG: site-specific DNA-methyltransferase [Leeuwenhoekiella sp.]
MSNATQQLKAQQRRQTFADLLREMFQLNQPELDFGLYRIMHARKDDINRFIEQDLPRLIQEAFSQYASQDQAQLEAELEEHIKSAKGLGMDPDAIPKVQELKQKLQGGFDLAREEGEVYDALVTFFNRYYNEGDFLSRRVYKDGTYAIPYQGEEVVLHWANKDQYYIKSSETLRDYRFRLNPDAGPGEDPMRVHFKLVDAEAGAKDNNIETAESRRVFVLDVEKPCELIEGEETEHGDQHTELQCRFVFRPATESDWTETEKNKASAAAQKKPPTQETLRLIAEEKLLGVASDLPEPWKSALAKPYRKADGNRADYSLFAGQLNNYTKKNTFDYFIHKDLGGFLTRELDFYIKNELLDWNDIASLKNDTGRLAPLLSKIEVIRSIGEKIISFLAQLENFQKKLWLKKKFVTETNYCISLALLIKHPNILEKVVANEGQLKEWSDLYSINLDELKAELSSTEVQVVLSKSLYRYMMLDTRHFDESFKGAVLSLVEDLGEETVGLLVHSENFQALRLLNARYNEQVKSIYIDPPYNTDSSSIPYKNNYKHSSFATLIRDRVLACQPLLKKDGAIFVSIDKTERMVVEHALSDVFGANNHIEELIWTQATANSQLPNYSTNHEYVEVFARDRSSVEADKEMFREPKPGFSEVMELISRLNSEYPSVSKIEAELKRLYQAHKESYRHEVEENGKEWNSESKRQDPWRGIYPYTNAEYRDENGRYLDPCEAEEKEGRIWVWSEIPTGAPASKQSPTTRDPEHPNYRFYKPVHPKTGRRCPCPQSGWKFPEKDDVENKGRRSFESLMADHRIAWGEDENKVPRTKGFLHEVETNIGTSVFYEYNDGEAELNNMFGSSGLFLSPKSSKFVKKFVLQSTKKNCWFMDFFGGSGSSAHAVINSNREDSGDRKFITVEMGSYFDLLTKPRICKAMYSSEWKLGKPRSNDGRAGIIKVLRLESYEDALGNLELLRSEGQSRLFDQEGADNARSRESYIINYMLEVESAGSQSLLNTKKFRDPAKYKLQVRSAGGDETKSVNVDLLETFNYLLGLEVEHLTVPIRFEAELSQGEYGRWQAAVKRSETGKWWFRTVYGTNRAGQQVLVVWRNLPSVIDGEADGIQKDNAVLDAVLIEKLSIRLTESQDDEIDVLYVNGDHNISIPRSRTGEPMEQARIQLIEEAFHRLMFADTEAVH